MGGRSRWSPRSDACSECGTDQRPHAGRGLCHACYQRLARAGELPPRLRRWSRKADACLACGRSDGPHGGNGLCVACYQRANRATPEGRARHLAEVKRYASSVHGREVLARYAATDHRLEERREATARYRASAHGRVALRAYWRRRREREAGVECEVPIDYELLVFAVFGRRCIVCGDDTHVELDHHRPLRAGFGLLHNAVPLCKRCNKQKAQRRPELFYDAWKLAEITVLLGETRAAYEARMGARASA